MQCIDNPQPALPVCASPGTIGIDYYTITPLQTKQPLQCIGNPQPASPVCASPGTISIDYLTVQTKQPLQCIGNPQPASPVIASSSFARGPITINYYNQSTQPWQCAGNPHLTCVCIARPCLRSRRAGDVPSRHSWGTPSMDSVLFKQRMHAAVHKVVTCKPSMDFELYKERMQQWEWVIELQAKENGGELPPHPQGTPQWTTYTSKTHAAIFNHYNMNSRRKDLQIVGEVCACVCVCVCV